MNQHINELATGLRSTFFSSRDTVEDAFAYAYNVIDAMPSEAKAAAYTALHVVVNTIANEMLKEGE